MGSDTRFRKLSGIIEALAPLCCFEIAEILCTDEVQYYRMMYTHFSADMAGLINGQFDDLPF